MKPDLCKYSKMFGAPGTGIHSLRIMNIAISDVIMTFIGGLLISYLSGMPYWVSLSILFISGIILHRIFCVRTTIDKILFPNAEDPVG